MSAGKIDNMVTPRRDGFDFDIDAIDTPVSVHVQLRNEAASDQTDPDFRHCGCLRLAVCDLYRVPPTRRRAAPSPQERVCDDPALFPLLGRIKRTAIQYTRRR